MALQSLRLLYKQNNALKSGVKIITARYSDHSSPSKPFIPVNRPPNEHLPFKIATIDDLPIPQGDYYEDYRKKQRKYWRDLMIGVTSVAISAFLMYYYEPVFFNAFPPEMPPKEERIKSFWDEDEEDEEEDEDEE